MQITYSTSNKQYTTRNICYCKQIYSRTIFSRPTEKILHFFQFQLSRSQQDNYSQLYRSFILSILFTLTSNLKIFSSNHILLSKSKLLTLETHVLFMIILALMYNLEVIGLLKQFQEMVMILKSIYGVQVVLSLSCGPKMFSFTIFILLE